MHTKDDIRDTRVKSITGQIEAIEKLAYALKSENGKTIMSELKAQFDILNKNLEGISLMPLKPPFFEYNKEDLQRMKGFRAQIHFMTELLANLQYEKLLEKARTKRVEAQAYVEGQATTPTY